jgi:diaminopimelate decarboxylase
VEEWATLVAAAVKQVGSPCYVSAWRPVEAAVTRLERLSFQVPVRSWLSFKTHPLEILAAAWLRSGRGIEVVSERELVAVLGLGASADQLLINGVAKHSWLGRHARPRLRVHFDSMTEIDELLPLALEQRWRVGVRLQAPDERDAHDPRFKGQFGLMRHEAVAALQTLQNAGADLQSVHFHLGQARHDAGAYRRAVDYTARVCDEAAFAPQFVDCGGALPAASDPACETAIADLRDAIQAAPARFPALREIWTENGRHVTGAASALAVTVLDVKDRDDCRYLICDGGRTNQALAADAGPHPILVLPRRDGPMRLTAVCGPTCMTDDRLGRWPLPSTIDVGDVIVWLDAGAYHLPWETRFSQGLCAIGWFDEEGRFAVARPREREEAEAGQPCVTR